MATKKTDSVKKAAPKKAPAKKAAPKAAKVKAEPVKQAARHPRARVIEKHGSKADLAKTIAAVIARADQDAGALEASLKKASNAQLLRLQRATQTLKDKFGSRDKLIAAIGTAQKKSKDKDYLAKLDSYSLPQLLDIAAGAQRAAR